ncbi:hypothetical protein J2751_000422 [Halorubrum alkaliphilum]|uniref:Uncharacterized protein n=1 Tax=Halorubrum alkaliphilum TaxID=261290 RepID=A0A8T4GBF8_9EURY|nr:hypothetical protein [Halorubrum alkaliphilum]MBP1921433.1 hypothetical protein [Halorubrum alkaliphilum]
MRLKPVPEPPTDLDALDAFRRAVPLVPGSEDDCCARLRDRRDLADRQAANDWLAFLRALGLARETPRGFVRSDAAATPELVREGLRDGVLLVPETLALLRDASTEEPVTPASLFAATRESVPRHDRARDPKWEATWRERADRLLRWLALVNLAEAVAADAPASEPGYVAGDAA